MEELNVVEHTDFVLTLVNMGLGLVMLISQTLCFRYSSVSMDLGKYWHSAVL